MRTGSDVLKARCNELAREAVLGSQRRSRRPVPIVLVLFGLLPWDPTRHPGRSVALQWIIRSFVALSATAFFLLSLGYLGTQSCTAGSQACWQHNGFLSQIPLPVGAILASALLSMRGQQEGLEETFVLLLGVSPERRYQEWHARRALRDKGVFVALWLCVVVGSAVSGSTAEVDEFEYAVIRSVLHACVMAVFGGVTLSFAYGLVHICRSLNIMIDAFCCDVVRQQSPDTVAHIWNMTQAILRKASVSVEHCLLVLCLIVVSTVPLLLVDVGVLRTYSAPTPAIVPALGITCGILYVLLLAATISEQCTSVPALVNAISFGEGMEIARQRTVDYISSSAAGFYVF